MTNVNSQEIVRRMNPGKEIRIYALSFRRNDGLLKDKLEIVACENRGYYMKVLNYAVVNAALQKILQVQNCYIVQHIL